MEEFIPEKYDARFALEEARRTMELAEFRCICDAGLIDRVVGLASERKSHEIVLVIEERSLSYEQNQALLLATKKLMQNVDSTKGIDKGCMDRRIGRLLCVLPSDLSQAVAIDCISHSRKSRRSAGLKCLNVEDIDAATYLRLIERFKSTGDARILKAILRLPLQLGCIDIDCLMEIFKDEEYWQMRVVEAALKADRAVGKAYATSHPYVFIWAAGRLGNTTLLPTVTHCLNEAEKKWPIVGIVAWAYGKFKASAELKALSNLMKGLERQHE